MSKFTKGPWRIDGQDISAPDVPCINICAGDIGPTFYHICDVASQLNEKSDQFELLDSDWANAHLIAAAPEMYEALESCEFYLEDYLQDAIETNDRINERDLTSGESRHLKSIRESLALLKASLKKARGES